MNPKALGLVIAGAIIGAILAHFVVSFVVFVVFDLSWMVFEFNAPGLFLAVVGAVAGAIMGLDFWKGGR